MCVKKIASCFGNFHTSQCGLRRKERPIECHEVSFSLGMYCQLTLTHTFKYFLILPKYALVDPRSGNTSEIFPTGKQGNALANFLPPDQILLLKDSIFLFKKMERSERERWKREKRVTNIYPLISQRCKYFSWVGWKAYKKIWFELE